jgi:hypothetical protein
MKSSRSKVIFIAAFILSLLATAVFRTIWFANGRNVISWEYFFLLFIFVAWVGYDIYDSNKNEDNKE